MKRVCEACGRARPEKALTRKCPGCGGRFIPAERVSAPVSVARDTSRRAAKNAEAFMAPMRRKVLTALAARGQAGGTDEEVMLELGTSANGVRPRRVELEAAGFVCDSGARRKTRAGLDAIVWAVTNEGRTVMRALVPGHEMCATKVIDALEAAERALASAKRALKKTPCSCSDCTARTLDMFERAERGPEREPSRVGPQ